MPLLLRVCPSFEGKWREFLDDWRDEPDPPLYVALSDLARHLINMLARNETASFPQIFAVVERWHLEGDSYVSEAATVGLLESLQNTALHDGTTSEQFRQYLKPASIKWWDKLHAFWERGVPLHDD